MKKETGEKKQKKSEKRLFKYIVVGCTITLADFLIYTVLMAVVFSENVDMAGVASIISGVIATCVAYLLHGNITWKNRNPGKLGVVKFFAWNAFMVILLRPLMSFGFKSLTGLYQFAYMISSAIHLPFSYDFVENTGLFVLMTIVTMTLNFLCYDRVVFGGKADKNEREEVDMYGVWDAGEKEKRQRKTKDNAKK